MGKIGFVFFADDWGCTKGGINNFNYDFCKALGVVDSKKEIEVFCVCKNTISQNQKKDANDSNVKVITIDESDFDNCSFEGIDFDDLFKRLNCCFAIYSVGHDIITGKQAKSFYDICCLRKLCPKLVLFHHMDYESYYGVNNSGERVREKLDKQINAFKNADYIIGVGPKLYESIYDKKIDYKLKASINQIIPGMAEIEPIREIKNRIKILYVGRIESNNDGIKQYGAVVDAFSKLYQENLMADGSNLSLLGISNSIGEEVENEIKKRATNKARQFINIFGLKYTDERSKVLDEYRTSSIVVMPSLSEGFGLVALEAISAGVPLVVTKNSGIYTYLKNNKLENYVIGVDIKGDCDGNINSLDVKTIYESLKNVVLEYKDYKSDSLKLKEKLLEIRCTWDNAAKQFVSILGLDDYFEYRFLFNVLPPSFKIFDISELLAISKKSVINNFSKLKAKNKERALFKFEASELEEFKDILQKTKKYDDSSIKVFLKDVVRDFLYEVVDNQLKSIETKNENIYTLLNFDFDTRLSFINGDVFIDDLDFDNASSSINIDLKKYIFTKLFTDDERQIINRINNDQFKKYHNVDLKGLSKSISDDSATLIPLNKIYAETSIKSRTNNEIEYCVDKDFTNKFIDFKKTIILGDPGTGKSTLIQKVVLDLCDEKSGYGLCCIPIKIADLSIEINNCEIDLDKYISDKFFDKNSELFKKLKRFGYLFVLLDGYDETRNEKEKENISNSIHCLLEKSPNSYYLATSRLVGYNNFFEKNGFLAFEMMPLNVDSVKAFIDQWFKVFSFDDNVELSRNISKGEKLKVLLNNDKTLMELSKNPLLLTIIVILQYHGVTPPTDKGRLYEVIIETLLQSWIERRGSLIKEYKIDFLTSLFSEIAYKMIEDNYSTLMIDEKTLKEVCVSYLTNSQTFMMTDNVDDVVNNFIKYVSESVGILLKRGEYNGLPCYSFLIHRQFTEYFAAIKLESKNEDEDFDIEDYVSEPKWVEVLILMFSFMNNQQSGGQKRSNRLIGKLIRIKSDHTPHINDLDYNYQIMLKTMINNVVVFADNKTIIQSFIINLFNTSNKYRFKQFTNELVLLFSSNYKDILINILLKDVHYNETQAFENAIAFFSNLYKYNSIDEINELVDKIDTKHKIIALFFESFVLKRGKQQKTLLDCSVIHLFANHLFPRFVRLVEKYTYSENEYDNVLKFICYYSIVDKYKRDPVYLAQKIKDIINETKIIKNDKIRNDLNRMMLLRYLVSDLFIDEKGKKAEIILKSLPECSDIVKNVSGCLKDFKTMTSLSVFCSVNGYLFIFNSYKKCTIKIITIKNNEVKIFIKEILSDDANDIVDFLINNNLDPVFFLKHMSFDFIYKNNFKKLSYNIQKWLLQKEVITSYYFKRNTIDLSLVTDDILIKNYDELFCGVRYKKISNKGRTLLSSIMCKLLIGNVQSLTKAEKTYLDKMYSKHKKLDTSECGIYYDLINKIYNPFNAK